MLALVVDPTMFPSDTISEAGFGTVLSKVEVLSRVVCSGVLVLMIGLVTSSLCAEVDFAAFSLNVEVDKSLKTLRSRTLALNLIVFSLDFEADFVAFS